MKFTLKTDALLDLLESHRHTDLDSYFERRNEHREHYNGGGRQPIKPEPKTVEAGTTSQPQTDDNSSTTEVAEPDDPDRRCTTFTPQQVSQIAQIIVPLLVEALKVATPPQHTPQPQTTPQPEYIDFVETSRRFGIPPGTLRRHVPNIKHYRRGKRLYFRIEDVEQWLHNGRVSTPVLVNQPSTPQQ